MRNWVTERLNAGIEWWLAVLLVMIVARLLGLIGWPWIVIFIPLWLPLVIGSIMLLLGKIGLVDVDDF